MKLRTFCAAAAAAAVMLGTVSCAENTAVSSDPPKIVENTVSIGKISSVEADLGVTELFLRLGDKNEVHYRVREDLVPKISENDGKLSVRKQYTGGYNYTGRDDDNYVEITLTEKELAGLDISDSAGDVFIEGFEAGGRVITASGSISLKNMGGGKDIEFDSSSGGVGLYDCTFGRITGETSSGSAYLENVTADRINLHTSSGSASVKLASLCNTDINASSGNITVSLPCKEDGCDLDISASSGDITVGGVKTEKKYERDTGSDILIKCQSSSGDIEVSFSGS
ncbi:MAG: DUF4097 family beta strand repeat protein [Ruminococcus sp.]|nr:DUF4097 family beta strand repeat protein [Ruminococcus sp.]